MVTIEHMYLLTKVLTGFACRNYITDEEKNNSIVLFFS